jgi:histidinol-phosphate aminotransferase
MSWLSDIARPDIVALKPYEHASWEPPLERMHANELPWRALGDNTEAGLNRYPEPQPKGVIRRLAALYDVPAESLLIGRGSDEGIDLLARSYCRAGQDAVIVCPPTFGMYGVAARIQGAEVIAVPLRIEKDFALEEERVLEQCTPAVKLVFLCSPNNPTGNLLSEDAVLRIARQLEGRALVVVDEAYVEFAPGRSLTKYVHEIPQLVILRTLSKAHGLAGARLGTLIASPEIVALLRKVIPPYAITQLTVEAVMSLLEPPQLALMRARIDDVRSERERLIRAFRELPGVVRVWPSDANFFLAEFRDPDDGLSRARRANLLIREIRPQVGLPRSLRVSIGSREQNERLLGALR